MNLLITGANRGIGLESVRQALVAGESVIATCRDPASATTLLALQQTFGECLRIEALEVTDADSVAALAIRLRGVPVEVLINNAGIFGGNWEDAVAQQRQTLAGMDYALWEDIFRTNVIGAFRVTAALLDNVLLGQRRLVVMMSSELGSIAQNTFGRAHAYRSSKAALNMLTRGLAAELAGQGVCVVAMAPGWTKTDLGGAGATYEVADSVARQRQVFAALGMSDSGRFVDLLGNTVPW